MKGKRKWKEGRKNRPDKNSSKWKGGREKDREEGREEGQTGQTFFEKIGCGTRVCSSGDVP
jgi:hypothetical protein